MITHQEFSNIVAESLNISEVLLKMKRSRVGSNYKLVTRLIAELGLSTDHWGYNHRYTRTPEELFCKDSTATTSVVKRRIISDSLISYSCSVCGNAGDWLGNPLVLRLDHINGINTDHRLTNLRFLCPNCDSQSSTYCGRNKHHNILIPKKCLDCGSAICATSKRCRACQINLSLVLKPRKPKIDWPPLETLLSMSEKLGFRGLGRLLGVSDNAIRNHIKNTLPD